MRTPILFLTAVIFLVASCSPRISTNIIRNLPPQPMDTEITIFNNQEQIPGPYEQLGTVSVGDAGMTVNCGYVVMLNLLKAEARKMGGNAVKITRHRPPDGFSSCHRFEAEVLLFQETGNIAEAITGSEDSNSDVQARVDRSTLPPDLIVFHNGDSIYCEIDKVTSSLILYSFSNEVGTFNSKAPVDGVQFYVMNFNRPERAVAEAGKEKYSPVSISFHGGYSYMPGEAADGASSFYKEYLTSLKHGWSGGADITFFIQETWGFGLKYNQFFSNGFYGNVSANIGGSTVYGDLSNKIRSKFIGPTFTYRKVAQKSGNTFYFGYGFGYLDYSDDGELINQEYQLSGSTLGTYLDLGYDFAVSENIALGLKLSGMMGTLSTIQERVNGITTTYTLEADQRLSTGNFDASFCLKFNF